MAVEPLASQLIRERTVAVLRAAATAAADRVYPSPILPLRRERPLPAIGVYTMGEVGTPLGNASAFQFQEACELRIEAVVELPTASAQTADERLRVDVGAPLDALVAEIYDALWPNPDWYICLIGGTERRERRNEFASPTETDRRTAASTITATLTYAEIYNPTIVDDFLTLWLDVDVIDPAADPNVDGHPTEPPAGYPGGYPGPDGRTEIAVRVPKTGTLWTLLGRGGRIVGGRIAGVAGQPAEGER